MKERLWVKPLGACLLSLLSIVLASCIDQSDFAKNLPEVSLDSVEVFLQILTGGMLAIATFAVGAMVSAYGSASSTATPRSFSVVISDDISQNALSVFIASFIFSVVGLVSLKNGLLDGPGRTVLFGLCIYVYVLVIYSFVKWVDRIARLGRLGTTIASVEKATQLSFKRRCTHPYLKAQPLDESKPAEGTPVFSHKVGNIQRVDIQALQHLAEETDCQISVLCLPGQYASPHLALAKVSGEKAQDPEFDFERILKAFEIGKDRIFDEDPRFGLIVLSEIAGKAMSPAINDPGTAIDVMASLHRLLDAWGAGSEADETEAQYDRIFVPGIKVSDLFEDAFRSLARDAASCVEVLIRMQTVLGALHHNHDAEFKSATYFQAKDVMARAELEMKYQPDLEAVKKAHQTHFQTERS
ncbi:DUF2254 domain-containing protein [Kiritimatiellota bacterium B12222]|nr:DUF2254 domain-containing protein [Kiritimatiellota bacterium B12222]